MFFGRGKNKVQNPITIKDSYDSYLKSIEKNSPYDLSKKEYLGICYLFMKILSKKIIENGEDVHLPNVGLFSIRKNKIKLSNINSIGIDYKLSNELGYRVKFTNPHSNGYKYFFIWSRIGINITNLSRYKFIATRQNKRKLAEIIKGRMRDYFEL